MLALWRLRSGVVGFLPKLSSRMRVCAQGNYERYMKQFEKFQQEFKNIKSFPDASMSVLGTYNFSTCAVVGSSGSLMNSTFGANAPHPSIVFVIANCRFGTRRHRTAL